MVKMFFGVFGQTQDPAKTRVFECFCVSLCILDGKIVFQCFWSDPKTRVFECFFEVLYCFCHLGGCGTVGGFWLPLALFPAPEVFRRWLAFLLVLGVFPSPSFRAPFLNIRLHKTTTITIDYF